MITPNKPNIKNNNNHNFNKPMLSMNSLAQLENVFQITIRTAHTLVTQ